MGAIRAAIVLVLCGCQPTHSPDSTNIPTDAKRLAYLAVAAIPEMIKQGAVNQGGAQQIVMAASAVNMAVINYGNCKSDCSTASIVEADGNLKKLIPFAVSKPKP